MFFCRDGGLHGKTSDTKGEESPSFEVPIYIYTLKLTSSLLRALFGRTCAYSFQSE